MCNHNSVSIPMQYLSIPMQYPNFQDNDVINISISTPMKYTNSTNQHINDNNYVNLHDVTNLGLYNKIDTCNTEASIRVLYYCNRT